MQRLRTFARLSARDQWLCCWTGVVLVAVEAATHVLPFARSRRLLQWLAATLPASRDQPLSAERIAWAVDAVDATVPGSRTCLVRSLTALTLLRHAGYEPTHHIGVARGADGTLEAHSWVEYDGEILLGRRGDLDRYAAFPALETDPAE